MSISMRLVAGLLAAMSLLTTANVSFAAELKVLTVIGMRAVLEELGPQFERSSGYKLVMDFVTSGDVIKRIGAGEVADAVIMPRQGIDRFVKEGKAVGSSVTVLARSVMGAAVRQGAPRPDISSNEAFRRALLAARTITYPNPAHGAASGVHFAKVLDRLGIANEVNAKTIFLPKAGPVGILVANGQAELAIHQVQELLPVSGIDIVGALPSDLQETLLFAAVVMTGSKNADAIRALVSFMQSPEAAKVIKAKGMEVG